MNASELRVRAQRVVLGQQSGEYKKCDLARDLIAVIDQLAFAEAVLDDYDEANPEARLRLDYEQRVEEAEADARGQAGEP